jgi:hypothetical protein
MAQTVVGVFDTHQKAIRAIEELRARGFTADQISILAPDPREVEGFAEEVGVRLVQASVAGATAGGIIGGLSGWLVGLAALAIPGAGLVVAAGPIAGALVGLIGGASLGGFIGILVALGLPRTAAEEYNREIMAGRTLLIVHPRGRFADAELALTRGQPLGLHHYDEHVGREVDEECLAALGAPCREALDELPEEERTTTAS